MRTPLKETGMMFKGPLVRAILEGRKTQTRRILKNQRAYDLDKCLYGQVGDLIYVRETWQHANWPLGPYQEDTPTFYRADFLHESDPDYVDAERTIRRNWLPSIHMPKNAARIWLEITGVRVERLHEITDADALAEGVDRTNTSISGYARERFKNLWQSTGADWDANPWVWVIDFKKCAAPAPKE